MKKLINAKFATILLLIALSSCSKTGNVDMESKEIDLLNKIECFVKDFNSNPDLYRTNSNSFDFSYIKNIYYEELNQLVDGGSKKSQISKEAFCQLFVNNTMTRFNSENILFIDNRATEEQKKIVTTSIRSVTLIKSSDYNCFINEIISIINQNNYLAAIDKKKLINTIASFFTIQDAVNDFALSTLKANGKWYNCVHKELDDVFGDDNPVDDVAYVLGIPVSWLWTAAYCAYDAIFLDTSGI